LHGAAYTLAQGARILSTDAAAAHDALTIVTVTYGSAAVLGGMLQSVPTGVRVIVVDNASTDGTVALARAAGAEVLALPRNIGFGCACNAGAARASTQWVLFLNPDARLAPDCIKELLLATAQHPQATAFNPRIRNGCGAPYFKHRSALLPRSAWMPRGWPISDCEVPVLSGAALLCSRAAFAAAGGFDERIFLYHEDDDLALRLQRLGPLRFVRAAEVTHMEGRSSPRSPTTARIKSFHMGRSRVYALRKHGRRLPFARSFGLALLHLCSPVAWVVARKRAQAAAFMQGVWSMRGTEAP
jgi:GT2 family glycosyltransferase